MGEPSQNGTINESTHNEPEEIDEQIPSCSTNLDNPGYPGFIEAVRQAKRKKKSRDASFEILFPYLPESVKKQHDFNLNEWWNYCLGENKDPLETDLSAVIGYLGKKLDVGTSRDDFESITSSVCLIASDKMEKQINESSFILSVLAKYLSVDNTDYYKTPESSCQNDSKMQYATKTSSIQIENVRKSKLPELIHLSDNDLDAESPSTSLQKSKNSSNNRPTNCKSSRVFSPRVVGNPQLTLSMDSLTPTSKSPRQESKKKVSDNNMTNKLITRSINGQQTQVVKMPERNTKNQKTTIENTPQVPSNNVVVDDESDLMNPTMPILSIKQEPDEYIQQQESTLPAANNTHTINPFTKTITQARRPSTPAKLPVHHNIQTLTPCQINTNVWRRFSKEIRQKRVWNTVNLQTKLLLGNAALKNQQPQKARSYLQNKSPVQSVYTNQSPERPEQSMNFDNSETNSIPPELSHRSRNSGYSYNEIEVSRNTDGYAFLQEAIDNPQTAIVQYQVEGNTVNILVFEPNGEQSLTTSDIPNEECTITDLLEQAGVPFNETTIVTLVKDPTLKINYIVESEAGTSDESNNANDESTNNDNTQLTLPVIIEKPKFIDGKVAVCDNCDLKSMDFNRCYPCKEKISSNPKTQLDTRNPVQKRINMMSINEFYRSLANTNLRINNFVDNISPHTICSTSKSGNSLSSDKNNTTSSNYNSESSIQMNTNNNKRKRSQLQVTAEQENSNENLPSISGWNQMKKKFSPEK
ncbi:hypothetical protein HCN44_007109 [Aphidius gifuensis]|uniref:Uncharacterized protein n=1 Tax=Aphidius gifuensis TaxID=684658 RepID=A0A835CLH2_APHGI|nr:hypothetical protein HCN44_007109 [Aphidius gifuensis]